MTIYKYSFSDAVETRNGYRTANTATKLIYFRPIRVSRRHVGDTDDIGLRNS